MQLIHIPKLKTAICISGHTNWRQNENKLCPNHKKPVVMNSSTVNTLVLIFMLENCLIIPVFLCGWK